MKTRAIRLYGAKDMRNESFELPEIGADEILMKVISDSVCASTYKAVLQGPTHKRVPEDIAENPIVIGHEMAGEIIKVGSAVDPKWTVGQKIVIQPALKLDNGHDPGYSYPYYGGNMTYSIIPSVALERECVLPYSGDDYFSGSLTEPIACCLRAFKGMYHTDYTDYSRTDGAKKGGKLAILGGAGPMGLASVELAIGYAGCSQVVVTDINQERLEYAASKCTPEAAKERGCELVYLNTSDLDDPIAKLLEISDGGFDDVFVMVPVPALLTMAEKIACFDGCINFFAGPAVKEMQASLNVYRVHYDGIHLVGTAGSIPVDTSDSIDLIEKGLIHPDVMVSHVLGLNAVPEVIFAMEHPNGVKKICYNHIDIPLVALSDIPELAKTDAMWAEINKILEKNGGNWCAEAEKYLLEHAPKIAE